jgi:predicted ATPase
MPENGLKGFSTARAGKNLGSINIGQVLVDLVPEFESFLGKQPPLGQISPQEARHRFANVLRNFFKVICLPEPPLVLFLDDWQWTDAASLELLRQLQLERPLAGSSG